MMDNINILIDKTFTEINTYSQYTKKSKQKHKIPEQDNPQKKI